MKGWLRIGRRRCQIQGEDRIEILNIAVGCMESHAQAGADALRQTHVIRQTMECGAKGQTFPVRRCAGIATGLMMLDG